MKILLVNPPTWHTARYPGRHKLLLGVHEFSPPIGLMYLKGYLKKNTSHDIRLFNFQVPSNPTLEDFEKYIRDFNPEMVGITSMIIFWYDICELARFVKKILPGTLLLLGGQQAWHYPDDVLKAGLFDIIVQGEGEITLIELVEALESGNMNKKRSVKSLRGIKGIIYKENDKIIHNTPRPVEKEPDRFAFPDRSDIDIKDFKYSGSRHHPSAAIMTSRGCPYQCTFCANNDRSFRPRRVEYVIEEILQCRDMGYKSIDFFDDNILTSKRHIQDLCRAMIQNKINMSWTCRARVDNVDGDIVPLMAEAGCWQMHMGVESAVQRHLDRVRKGISVEMIRNAFVLARRAGITTLAYFMFGFPDETLEDAEKTISFAFELDPDYVYVNTLIPPPGTLLYREALEDPSFGGDYFREYAVNPIPDFVGKVWATRMTEREILSMQNKLFMKFYFRPKKILQFIRKVTGPRDLFIKARLALKLLLAR